MGRETGKNVRQVIRRSRFAWLALLFAIKAAGAEPLYDPGLSLQFTRDEGFGENQALRFQAPLYRRNQLIVYGAAEVGKVESEPFFTQVRDEFGKLSLGARYDLNTVVQLEAQLDARDSSVESSLGLWGRASLDLRAIRLELVGGLETYRLHDRVFERLSEQLGVTPERASGLRGNLKVDVGIRDALFLPAGAELFLTSKINGDLGPAAAFNLRRRSYGDVDLTFLSPLGPERDLDDLRPPSQVVARLFANSPGEVDGAVRADYFLTQRARFDVFTFADYQFERPPPTYETTRNELRLGFDEQWEQTNRIRWSFEQGVGYDFRVDNLFGFVAAEQDWRLTSAIDLTNRLEVQLDQNFDARLRTRSALRFTKNDLRLSAFVDLDEVRQDGIERVVAGGEVAYTLTKDFRQVIDLSGKLERRWDRTLPSATDFELALILRF